MNVSSGQSAEGYGWIWPEPNRVAVKAPVFSWQKLTSVDVSLSPEMKSTGEVIGSDRDFPRALYKTLLAAGLRVPQTGAVLITVADRDKAEILPIAAELASLGFRIFATSGTARALKASGIPCTQVNKVSEGSTNILDLVRNGEIHLVINTPSRSNREVDRDGFLIRRTAVEHNVTVSHQPRYGPGSSSDAGGNLRGDAHGRLGTARLEQCPSDLAKTPIDEEDWLKAKTLDDGAWRRITQGFYCPVGIEKKRKRPLARQAKQKRVSSLHVLFNFCYSSASSILQLQRFRFVSVPQSPFP